jgi:acetyltransferase
MRFMRIVHAPDRERLRSVLASFPEAGIGLVATVPADDGLDIVGSAIAVVGVDPTRCEFAITVAAGFGGVGLATALMTALIDAARRRGLAEMEGFVLSQNRAMLGLAKRLGFSIAYEPGDASVRICRLTLNPP